MSNYVVNIPSGIKASVATAAAALTLSSASSSSSPPDNLSADAQVGAQISAIATALGAILPTFTGPAPNIGVSISAHTDPIPSAVPYTRASRLTIEIDEFF